VDEFYQRIAQIRSKAGTSEGAGVGVNRRDRKNGKDGKKIQAPMMTGPKPGRECAFGPREGPSLHDRFTHHPGGFPRAEPPLGFAFTVVVLAKRG